MKILALSTLALALGFGSAHAQSPAQLQSVIDTYSPGTVGAMSQHARGIATSAEDVAMQQEGRSTAAEGGVVLTSRTASQAVGQSAGTVGAAPGGETPSRNSKQ
jgi:hypothetical protein